MRKTPILALFLLALTATSALGSDVPSAVRTRLATLLPGMQPDSIRATPVDGLYEVAFGAQIVYVSADGQYLLRGNLIDLADRQDLTEQRRDEARVAALAELDPSQTIVYAPDDGPAKHTITVFTDVDCPYCRRLHEDLDDYLERGIKVRYLMFPRSGMHSPTSEKMISVWCSDDPSATMTQAIEGKKVPAKSCDNPVAEQLRLGKMLGVSGTPAIVLEDGEMIPGYAPAERIARLLDASASAAR